MKKVIVIIRESTIRQEIESQKDEMLKYFYEWTEDLLDTELFIWYEFVNLKSYIILNMTMQKHITFLNPCY